MEWITALSEQYGYIVLLLGLFAESLALPFPGELAMAVFGHLTSLGSLHLPVVMLYSYGGALAGTMLTYYLGYRLGTPFFDKYGKFFLLNAKRIEKVSSWFAKYGDKIILISYFVPGLRHFTGYVSGMLKVRFTTLLIYNGLGGALWVTLYVMIGKLFGHRIGELLHQISQYSAAAVAGLAVLLIAAFVVKQKKTAITKWLGRNL
ncbi:membrane protein DedA, SNARE-associated domain [Paenibacillus sp. UNCCL117]|uniref:DedA family protein n=1 Tax=unclassified Paenibacillus TaxID=185978 RepID=UPI00088AA796|nr:MULTISPECIES: DedA family protein [unclassified Paenibacillus]SDD58678.1 membrane protein DedA, SNARE-associated domain [Paenibacillus sp. cl123]SFW50965.1 membrane protein DedA, SNARE-associated domain [Paenibacillus sp. UNCCL117]